MKRWPCRALLATAAMFGAAVAMTAGSDQPGSAFPGLLHEHPSIQYATRPTSDRVARLNRDLIAGSRSLVRDSQTGFLRPVLDGLGLSPESQLLVFSKTGVQREYTSPRNPRAIYFDDGVVVAYVPGAPALEIAAEDRDQGVVFYTLDQTANSSPTFTRRMSCLSCHVSASTLDVPGIIVRSHAVGDDGGLVPEMATQTVNHVTPHTQRWGGWFVTNRAVDPPYQALGHMGNITFAVHPRSGPSIFSNRVMVEWLDSDPERRGYLSSASDIGGLLAFDHQSHAMNQLTRLNWESRIAGAGGLNLTTGLLHDRVNELADYLLFVGEFPPIVPITPRPGFAERMTARAPADRLGRSLGQLDLTRRLLRYPCSYMVYADAFEGLLPEVRTAVYRRMFEILSGKDASAKYAHLSEGDRHAIIEILRDTKANLPEEFRP